MRELDKEKDQWSDKTKFKMLKEVYADNWKMLFEISDLGDLDRPLTEKILSDPENKITKHILYLYSMESFIYANLNRVCRDKEKALIQYYGSFAATLSYIIFKANSSRSDKITGGITLYRGLQIDSLQLNEFEIGGVISLTGYTSSSRSFDIAKKFALSTGEPNKLSVIFKIESIPAARVRIRIGA